MTDDDSYVTNAAWLRLAGRVDHIDEVADQFERPVEQRSSAWPQGRADFWSAVTHWPRSTGALRSARLHRPATQVSARAS